MGMGLRGFWVEGWKFRVPGLAIESSRLPGSGPYAKTGELSSDYRSTNPKP